MTLESYGFIFTVLQIKAQVKWNRDAEQWWQAWLRDSSGKQAYLHGRLSVWKEVWVLSMISSAATTDSPPNRLHFVLEFCINMYISLNMKMTVTAIDLRKQAVRWPPPPPLWLVTHICKAAIQPARVRQTTLTEQNVRKSSLKGDTSLRRFWASVIQWFYFLTSGAIRMLNNSWLF